MKPVIQWEESRLTEERLWGDLDGFVLGRRLFQLYYNPGLSMYMLFPLDGRGRKQQHLGDALPEQLDELKAAAEEFVPELLRLAALGKED